VRIGDETDGDCGELLAREPAGEAIGLTIEPA
jgi:hypothetical protein